MKKMLFMLALLMAAGALSLFFLTQPILKEDTSFEITAGSAFKEVGQDLENAKIIRSAFVWQVVGQIKGQKAVFSGTYRFSPQQNMFSVLDDVNSGNTSLNYVPLTVPEGSTAEQIALYVERAGLAKAEDFLAVLESYNSDSMAEGVIYELEGYLFPETYFCDFNMTPQAIIEMMLNQFDLVYASLEIPSDFPYTKEELVILASIVEKESQLDKEIGLVAGVFLNRLEIDMALQSCATVNYILRQDKLVLSAEDIALDSLYNTYIYSGLPPGPVSNPGKAALEAVLYPEESDYFFFVAGPDGTHKFSVTYEEHEYWTNIFYGD